MTRKASQHSDLVNRFVRIMQITAHGLHTDPAAVPQKLRIIPQTLFQRQRFVGKRQKTYWPCPPHSDFATIPNFIFPSHFSTANGKTSILRTLELPGRYLPREYLLITGMKTQRSGFSLRKSSPAGANGSATAKPRFWKILPDTVRTAMSCTATLRHG